MATAKIPFKSAYDTRTKTMAPSHSGEKVIKEHRETVDEKGERILIKDRKVNIYDKIQASAESCDIEMIVRRAAEGDTSVLNAMAANYVDVVDAPATLAEAQQFVINARREFETLPLEVRRAFNNDAQQYVASYGSDYWKNATGIQAEIERREAKAKLDAEFKANQEKAFANLAAETGGITNE